LHVTSPPYIDVTTNSQNNVYITPTQDLQLRLRCFCVCWGAFWLDRGVYGAALRALVPCLVTVPVLHHVDMLGFGVPVLLLCAFFPWVPVCFHWPSVATATTTTFLDLAWRRLVLCAYCCV
jgi:hypothetical protein